MNRDYREKHRYTLSLTGKFLCCLLLSTFALAEESNTPATTNSQPEQPGILFSWPLENLVTSNIDLETHELRVREHLHPVYEIGARGRKPRGNLLLLTDYHEMPLQTSFGLAIGTQLSSLGWQVFAPAIAVNDAAIPPQEKKLQKANQDKSADNSSSKGSNKDSSPSISAPKSKSEAVNTSEPNPDSAPDSAISPDNKPNAFFQSGEDYQNYYCELIQQVVQSTELKGKPFVILTHGNAGYWSLACLPKFEQAKYFAMIHPALDSKGKLSLKELFSRQRCPLFLFATNTGDDQAFVRAIEKRYWTGSKVRLNQGLVDPLRLPPEDPRIARMITGWVEAEIRVRSSAQ